MNYPKAVVILTALFFLIYGLMFSLFPMQTLQMVTGVVLDSGSGLIDLRATYGGMSVAAGILLFSLGNKTETLRTGLLGVFLLMAGMAATRMLGMALDGPPNQIMVIYLILEIAAMILSFTFMRMTKTP